MWLLISEHLTLPNIRGTIFPLLLNKEQYNVGRDSSSEMQMIDPCVSRKHAILYPVSDVVKLEDEKSRFGTFVNGKDRIQTDAHTFLKDDDLICFGRKENAWRLRKVEISVITTKLDPRDSLELKSLLRTLNGNHISSDWSNSVTHLVAPTVNFTIKFLLALVNCVPIVNLQFFRDAESVVKATGSLPDVANYIPTVADDFPEVCDFTVNERRKEIFKGLVFIFLDERKMATFQKIVKSAGGTVTAWDKKKSSVIRVSSRVIGDIKGDAEHQELHEYLLGKGRRLIPDTEIGLAIATVCLDRYCNPKYSPEVGHILSLETPYVRGTNSSDVICMEEIPETIYVDDEEHGTARDSAAAVAEKTRMRVCDKTVTSNTEVPETVATVPGIVSQNHMPFPDDDDEEFNERSQQMLDLVEKHSSMDMPKTAAAPRKRRHSGSDSEDSQATKKTHSQASTTIPDVASQEQSQPQPLKRFDSSQFITRPSQKLSSQAAISEPIRTAATIPSNGKPKRTLADLLAKDDEDSDEELLNFKKKPKKSSASAPKKTIPSLLRPLDGSDKSPPTEVDGPVKPPPEIKRVHLSQLTDGWLSKTLRSDCTIKAESLDATRAWIAPLLNSIQVKELKVDLLNRSGAIPLANISNEVSANVSGKRNFKHFRKQSVYKCVSIDPELTKTKSVLITEKL